MKPFVRLTVLILPAICLYFADSGTALAQGTGTGTGESGIAAQQAGQRQEFTGEAVAIDTEIIADQRRESINADTGLGGTGGTNAFGGGANPFQSFFGGAGAQGFQGLNSQFGTSQGIKSKIVRAPMVVAFERPAASRRSTQQIASQVSTTFTRLPRFRGDAITAISFEGVIVLTGSVSSESKKAAAARVAKMEPGISRVENRLVVVADAVN